MSHENFLADLAIVLCVAAPTSLLFRVLRQPAILGYLLAGVVVGPYTPIPPYVHPERVAALSEFGVVLVMFSVGLEFSIARFLKVLPTSGFTALVEISALAVAGYALGQAFGWSTIPSLFLAGALSISSTMVVAKVFDEHPPEPSVREMVFGVLVVQDVVAIALLAVLSAVAAGAGVTAEALGMTLFELGGFLFALLIGGMLVVPRFIRFVQRTGTPETIVVVSGALCFGMALLAEEFGYSVALGAFLAGMLAAESGRGHAIEHLITPLKDLFVAVFFVSIGMSVDPALVWEQRWVALAILATVVVGQFASVTIAGLLGGNGMRRSVEASLALGQIGEFAFIMAGIGIAAGVVPPFFGAVLVAVAIATSFTTPLLVGVAPRLVALIDRWTPAWFRALLSLYEAWLEQLRERGLPRRWRRPLTVLALEAIALAGLGIGLGLLHPKILYLLQEVGLGRGSAQIVYTVVEIGLWLPFVLGILRASRRLAALLGDSLLPPKEAGQLDLAATPRRSLIVALQLAIALAVTAPIAVVTLPFTVGPWTTLLLGVVVLAALQANWKGARNLDGHLRASAEVVAAALRRRADSGVEADDSGRPVISPDIEELLPGVGTVEIVTISEGPFLGRTLGEIGLQGKTGAAVLALVRKNDSVARPGSHEILGLGDNLALIGCRDSLAAARALLTGEDTQDPAAPDHAAVSAEQPAD